MPIQADLEKNAAVSRNRSATGREKQIFDYADTLEKQHYALLKTHIIQEINALQSYCHFSMSVFQCQALCNLSRYA